MSNQATGQVVISRIFDAPRELVYKAWTDPKLVSQWWGPDGVTNPECDIDVRVGGKLHIVMLAGAQLGELEGQRWPMQGEFTEVKALEKLVFINQAIDEDGNVLIDGVTTVEFSDEGHRTKLTLTTTAKGVAPSAAQMIQGMNAGWTQSIDKLGRYVTEIQSQ